MKWVSVSDWLAASMNTTVPGSSCQHSIPCFPFLKSQVRDNIYIVLAKRNKIKLTEGVSLGVFDDVS